MQSIPIRGWGGCIEQSSATARSLASACSSSGRHLNIVRHSAWRSREGTSDRGGRKRTRRLGALPLFDPPPFQPAKLSVSYSSGATSTTPSPPESIRRYTLTHNDITGQLWLTVGREYNEAQISGFYTRLLRDEVVAEWKWTPGHGSDVSSAAGPCAALPSLHLFCHVSGEERWLAPPFLRNYIFRREIPLVRASSRSVSLSLSIKHTPPVDDRDDHLHTGNDITWIPKSCPP